MSIMSALASTSTKYSAYIMLSMIAIYMATEFVCKSIMDLVSSMVGGS